MKIFLSAFLALTLCDTTPTPCHADPPPEDTTLAMACFVAVIGTITAVGLWKLCKCIPSPPVPITQPPPPPTNPPPLLNPTNAPPTNKPPWWKRPFANLVVNSNAVAQYNIASAGHRDGYGNVYTFMLTASLESTTNAIDWVQECAITGYVSSAAAHFSYWSNGVPIVATYNENLIAGGGTITNYVPFPVGSGDEPSKMFRLSAVK
jgi:hypothetical protein